MADSSTSTFAKLAWIIPAFFLVLSFNQAKVAYDLSTTKAQGTPLTVSLDELHLERRVDVTYDYIKVSTDLPGGGRLDSLQISLPHSLVPALEGRTELQAKYLAGGSPQIVITETIGPTPVVDTQQRIAMMNAGIAWGRPFSSA